MDVRLAFLCLLVFLPLAVNDFFMIRAWQAEKIEAAQEELLRLAKSAARENSALISATKDLLTALSRVGDIRDGDNSACSATLRQVAGQFDRYTIFFKSDLNGRVVCSSSPLQTPLDVSNTQNVSRAMRTKEFAIGPPKIGLVSGKPIMGFSLPMLDDRGQLTGLVNTGLSLDWLEGFLADLNPSQKFHMILFDGEGRVLASLPRDSITGERSSAPAGLRRLALLTQEGVGETAGADGQTIFCGFTRVKSVPGTLFFGAYMSKETVLGDLREDRLRRYALYGLVILISLTVAWLAARFFVLKWVRGLLVHARRLAEGDLGSNSGLPHDNSDMGGLAKALDHMAAKIAGRDEALRESHRNILGLINAIGESVLLLDAEGKILAVNHVGAARLGTTVEKLLRQETEDAAPSELFQKRQKIIAQARLSRGPVSLVDEFGGRIYETVLYPILDEQGEMDKAAVFAQDVTERVRAEESLLQSQKSLAKSQDMARLGNWSWDVESNRVVWSRALYRLLEVNPEDLPETYETLLSLVHPEDREMVKRALSESIFEEKGADIEHRMLKPFGGELFVHTLTDVIYQDFNDPAGLVGTVQDITAWKIAERKLRDSEARTRAIVDAAAEGIITIDQAGVVESFNRAAEAIFGYAAAEVVGRKVNLLMPEPHRTRHDDYIAGYLRTGVKKIIGQGLEVEGVRKDGTTFPLDLSVSEVVLGNGRIFTGLLRDISDRKTAEAALKKSRASLAKAQEIARLGNWDWDLETGAVYWSDEIYRLFGLSPEDFKSDFNAYLAAVHPRDREAVKDKIRQALKQGGSYTIEHRIIHADGEVRFASGHGETIPGPDGRLVRLVGTVQDITERKAAERELRIKESAIQSSINAIVLAGLDGPVTFVNHAMLEMWGLENPGEILGRPLESLFAENEAVSIRQEVLKEGAWFGERTARRDDGVVFQVQVSASLVTEDQGEPICLMAGMVDITEQKKAEELLRIQAVYDSLTGLYNRRRFMEVLEVQIKEARRHGLELAVCICDLDHFKSVNDAHGHRAGDEVLAGFGRLLRQALRAEDAAGRYGGEEFALVLPHSGRDQAEVVLERIRKKLEQTPFTSPDGASFSVTASFGLAQFRPRDDNETTLLDRADEALYRAKKNGRNRIETE
ncbi:MAG: PAS domain S-box protein [Pseudomonadota bacterium]